MKSPVLPSFTALNPSRWIGTFSIEAGGTGDEALQEESQVRFFRCRFAQLNFNFAAVAECGICHASLLAQGQLAEFIAHIEKQKVSGAPACACIALPTLAQVVQLDALADVFKLTPVEVCSQTTTSARRE